MRADEARARASREVKMAMVDEGGQRHWELSVARVVTEYDAEEPCVADCARLQEEAYQRFLKMGAIQ